MRKSKISKAQIEVWEWKELAFEEVSHLPIRDALRKRILDSMESVEKLGLPVVDIENPKLTESENEKESISRRTSACT